ncbi:hypothetical protein Acife_1087 [Acidithiobacillus ferrivorans SS3]|uniref:Uncharacterized protein n=1 Tax=Acidithiobacillus ferrivorans SS3 TaxID=743299 RepID=G0JNV0_9PROT|nr:hypothetical protein Acife_1087 [Acidithiobacillus ferrivorans SS3]
MDNISKAPRATSQPRLVKRPVENAAGTITGVG